MRRLAFFVCGTTLMAGGLFAAACGTDNGNSTGQIPQVDGAATGKGDGSVKNDGGSTPDDDSSTPGSDAGADCSAAAALRDNSNGFFCKFLEAGTELPDGAAAKSPYCGNEETCCNAAKNADNTLNKTFCASGEKGTGTVCKDYAAANGFAYPDNAASPASEWECADKNQCADGQVCCMYTSSLYPDPKDKVNIGKTTDKDIPASCNALQAFKQGGTHCVTGNQCPAGDKPEIKLCSKSDDNCATGTACTPFQAFFRDLAYCR